MPLLHRCPKLTCLVREFGKDNAQNQICVSLCSAIEQCVSQGERDEELNEIIALTHSTTPIYPQDFPLVPTQTNYGYYDDY